MTRVEMVVFTRKDTPCRYCREKDRQTFGGQTFTYKVLPKTGHLRVECEITERVDFIQIAACPKCGRLLGEDRRMTK